MSEHTPTPDPWAPPPDGAQLAAPRPDFPPPGPPAPQPAGDGLAIASLVLGIVGVVLGFTVFLFWVAGVLGLLALVLGLVGRGRVRRGLATNKRMALAGAILGGCAIVLAIAGLILSVFLVV